MRLQNLHSINRDLVLPYKGKLFYSNINYKELFVVLLTWLFTGVILGLFSIPLLISLGLYLQNKERHLHLFIIFFFTLILSDSRLSGLRFAQDLKTFLAPLLLLPFFISSSSKIELDLNKTFHRPFIVYIIFAIFCIIFSPVPFTAFQKTISYLLIFLLVPVLSYSLFKLYDIDFLKTIVYLGTAVLIMGYIMYLINPTWVMYAGGGRSSGALGNPNGLGMFCFLFFMLYFSIKHYFPEITSKRWNVFIYVLIITSLIWSGSRGQTVAILVFLVTMLFSKRNKTMGVLVSALIGIIFVTIDIDIVAIAHTLGFENYLRVDTLEAGGGRVVAREFAWDQIYKNIWVGRGFSYTEWIYHQHFWELSMRGHEGNAHNAFLTVWLDTGLIGLILFVIGWGALFMKAAKKSYLALPVAFSVIASNMVESWLAASLNPFTIQLLIILTLLIFIIKDKDKIQLKPLVLTQKLQKF